MVSPTLVNQLLLWPILNILIGFYKLFEVLRLPGPFGFALIALTLTIRLLLHPLTASQLKTSKKMQDLKPHLDHLAQKHGKDKRRLQEEQLKLYKEHGLNPAAGCLPLLIQIPIIYTLYNLFLQIFSTPNIERLVKDINSVLYLSFLKINSLDVTFFGINLADKPSSWQTVGAWLLLIPILTGLLQWAQARLMSPAMKAAAPEKKPKERTGSDDFAQAMQLQMNVFLPVMFGFFAYSFPLGLSLYWNTFTIFGILQQVKLSGWGGLTAYIEKIRSTKA